MVLLLPTPVSALQLPGHWWERGVARTILGAL